LDRLLQSRGEFKDTWQLVRQIVATATEAPCHDCDRQIPPHTHTLTHTTHTHSHTPHTHHSGLNKIF